jgi:hypothetical protein
VWAGTRTVAVACSSTLAVIKPSSRPGRYPHHSAARMAVGKSTPRDAHPEEG